MTTITREQQKQILIDTANHVISRDNTSPYSENLRELARIALASLGAKPIGAFHIADQQVEGTSDYIKDGEWPIDNGVIEVYAAQPASEHEQIRREHAEWSDKTFGDVGPVGALKHLSKEALEAAAEPDDLSEWADMQFLLWDAQRRAGISDGEITAAMIEKLAVNKKREWPEPKDGEPRLHIKEQPAPVGLEEHYQRLSELYHAQEKRLFKIAQRIKGPTFDKYAYSPSQAIDVLESAIFGENEATCRAALLQGSQPVSNRDELQVIGWLRSDYNSDDKRDPNAPLFMLGSNDPSEAWGVKYIPLSGNSPVIPDGWISCSERMPAQDDWVLIYSKYGEYLAGQVQGKYVELNDGTLSWLGAALHWMPLPEPPEPDQN
ncbi:DUF550 domain-containing protein [Salmonella enterica]|nr:DUF550 domain-containing protein [Salmonella enterica]